MFNFFKRKWRTGTGVPAFIQISIHIQPGDLMAHRIFPLPYSWSEGLQRLGIRQSIGLRPILLATCHRNNTQTIRAAGWVREACRKKRDYYGNKCSCRVHDRWLFFGLLQKWAAAHASPKFIADRDSFPAPTRKPGRKRWRHQRKRINPFWRIPNGTVFFSSSSTVIFTWLKLVLPAGKPVITPPVIMAARLRKLHKFIFDNELAAGGHRPAPSQAPRCHQQFA